MDKILGILSSLSTLSIAANLSCCVKEPPMPNKKLAMEKSKNEDDFVAKKAIIDAIKRQIKPENTAVFLPWNFAIMAAGIEPAATPRIIKVIGNVANDLLVVSSLDNKPPIKTIMGAEHVTKGCVIKSKLTLSGKLNLFVRKMADTTITVKTKKIVAIASQIPLPK